MRIICKSPCSSRTITLENKRTTRGWTCQRKSGSAQIQEIRSIRYVVGRILGRVDRISIGIDIYTRRIRMQIARETRTRWTRYYIYLHKLSLYGVSIEV
jgi:hypothetical protein